MENLRLVVNAGGDTDTNGAVAGAALGARLGYEAIPQRWRLSMSNPQQLLDLADGLLSAAQRDERSAGVRANPD